MKAHYFSLLAGVLALVATALPQTARAQAVCFTTLSGALTADVTLDATRDIFYGTGSGLVTYQVTGGRGTTGSTIRHHYFDFSNPAAGNDPSCSDGTGVVDYLVFNGRVTGSSGGVYNWTGSWRNSCGTEGSTTGTIALGACPAPRQPAPAESAAQRVTAAAVLAEGPVSGDADVPLVAAVPEGDLTYCYTNGIGYENEGMLDLSTNIFYGTGSTGTSLTWLVHGGRGTASRETRHHTFTWQNPDADNNADCTDGTGATDWFTYNGSVSGSGPYAYSAVWRNSCGSTGVRDATIALGSCPGPRTMTPVPGSEAMAPAAAGSASAGAEVTGPVALTSSPNPFARSTTISYALAEAGDVRLSVYDVLGREVAVLVDEAQEAGVYSVPFEGASLPAGTYLYRLEAGAHVAVKPMTLVR